LLTGTWEKPAWSGRIFKEMAGNRKLMTPGIKSYSRRIFQGQLRAGAEAKRCFLPERIKIFDGGQ